jgi:hypothetical protein
MPPCSSCRSILLHVDTVAVLCVISNPSMMLGSCIYMSCMNGGRTGRLSASRLAHNNHDLVLFHTPQQPLSMLVYRQALPLRFQRQIGMSAGRGYQRPFSLGRPVD